MISLSNKVAFGTLLAVSSATAFQSAKPMVTRTAALNVAVDPTTVSKKDYEDICGVSFNEQSIHERLRSTKFLYPKHVEVIEDIAPIASDMVDELVSHNETTCLVCGEWQGVTRNSMSSVFHSMSSVFHSCSLYCSSWRREKPRGSLRTFSPTCPSLAGKTK